MTWWIAQLGAGKLPPEFEVTEDLLKEMGVSTDESGALLATLKNHHIKTWGCMVAIKSAYKLVQYTGDEITGNTLWAYLESYRNKKKLRPAKADATHMVSSSELLCPIPHFKSYTIQRENLLWGSLTLENLSQKFVQHAVYTKVYEMLDNMLARLPNIDDRNHVAPDLVGATGVGKTRTALEACNAVAQKHEGTVVLYFRVRQSVFHIAAFDNDLDVLSNALVLATKATLERSVCFAEVCKALHRDGFSKVLLHIDDVQLKYNLVKRLVAACFTTMSNTDSECVCVVPVITGIELPVRDDLPMRGSLGQMQITLLEPRDFIESLAERIGVDPASVEQNTHLNELLHLCSGSPHAVDLMTQVIRKEADARPHFRQG